MLGCTGRLIPQEGTQGHPMRAGRALTPATQLRWVHLTPRELRPHCQAQGAVSAPGHNKRPEKRPALGAGLLCTRSPQRGPITTPIVQVRPETQTHPGPRSWVGRAGISLSMQKKRPAWDVWVEVGAAPSHNSDLDRKGYNSAGSSWTPPQPQGSCTWCWQRLLTALWAGRTAWVCMGPRAGLPPCVACACAMRVCRARVPSVPCACLPRACGRCVRGLFACCARVPCMCAVCMCRARVCHLRVCSLHVPFVCRVPVCQVHMCAMLLCVRVCSASVCHTRVLWSCMCLTGPALQHRGEEVPARVHLVASARSAGPQLKLSAPQFPSEGLHPEPGVSPRAPPKRSRQRRSPGPTHPVLLQPPLICLWSFLLRLHAPPARKLYPQQEPPVCLPGRSSPGQGQQCEYSWPCGSCSF